jgi:hypothetical protein
MNAEYNLYCKIENNFLGTYSSLKEMKIDLFHLFCDNEKETLKELADFFAEKIRPMKQDQFNKWLDESFSYYYKKEDIGTHLQYFDKDGVSKI